MSFKNLLWVDCLGALLAGVLMLALSSWLAGFYGLPWDFFIAITVANLAYGAYSLTLALRKSRPLALIVLLAAANVAWGVFCFAAAIHLAATASPFGLAHLVLEGLYVGGLGLLEWSRRHQLVSAA